MDQNDNSTNSLEIKMQFQPIINEKLILTVN